MARLRLPLYVWGNKFLKRPVQKLVMPPPPPQISFVAISKLFCCLLWWELLLLCHDDFPAGIHMFSWCDQRHHLIHVHLVLVLQRLHQASIRKSCALHYFAKRCREQTCQEVLLRAYRYVRTVFDYSLLTSLP
jgi:hypothetical protein